MPPSSVVANNSRIPLFVFGHDGSPGLRADRLHRAPIRRICYWVVDVVVCCVVVTTADEGCVVVFVTLSDATPLLLR